MSDYVHIGKLRSADGDGTTHELYPVTKWEAIEDGEEIRSGLSKHFKHYRNFEGYDSINTVIGLCSIPNATVTNHIGRCCGTLCLIDTQSEEPSVIRLDIAFETLPYPSKDVGFSILGNYNPDEIQPCVWSYPGYGTRSYAGLCLTGLKHNIILFDGYSEAWDCLDHGITASSDGFVSVTPASYSIDNNYNLYHIDDLRYCGGTVYHEGNINKLDERYYTESEVDTLLDKYRYRVGDVKTTTRSDMGDNWLLCDGSEIDASMYSDLAAFRPKEWRVNKNMHHDKEVGLIYADNKWVSVGSDNIDGHLYCYLRTWTELTGTWTDIPIEGGLATRNDDSTHCDIESFEPEDIAYYDGTWVMAGTGNILNSDGDACVAVSNSLYGPWTYIILNNNDVGNPRINVNNGEWLVTYGVSSDPGGLCYGTAIDPYGTWSKTKVQGNTMGDRDMIIFYNRYMAYATANADEGYISFYEFETDTFSLYDYPTNIAVTEFFARDIVLQNSTCIVIGFGKVDGKKQLIALKTDDINSPEWRWVIASSEHVGANVASNLSNNGACITVDANGAYKVCVIRDGTNGVDILSSDDGETWTLEVSLVDFINEDGGYSNECDPDIIVYSPMNTAVVGGDGWMATYTSYRPTIELGDAHTYIKAKED